MTRKTKASSRYRPEWWRRFSDTAPFTFYPDAPMADVIEQVRKLDGNVKGRSYRVQITNIDAKHCQFVVDVSVKPTRSPNSTQQLYEQEVAIEGIVAETDDGRVIVDGVVQPSQEVFLISVAAVAFIPATVITMLLIDSIRDQLACLVLGIPVLMFASIPYINYIRGRGDVVARVHRYLGDMAEDPHLKQPDPQPQEQDT